ncbi:hypothetical protein ACFL6P_06475 [Candidatus Latescibacterota bacterium]
MNFFNTVNDVAPLNNGEEEVTFPGSSLDPVPPPPKPKKGFIERAIDAISGSDDIQLNRAKQKALREAADREIAELDSQIAQTESTILTQQRERDPGYRREQKQQEAFMKARQGEARRAAALAAMLDEYERRHPIKNEKVISYYWAQLNLNNLWGLFARPQDIE